jgi:hypothetical protein
MLSIKPHREDGNAKCDSITQLAGDWVCYDQSSRKNMQESETGVKGIPATTKPAPVMPHIEAVTSPAHAAA